jgi:hypothetical protein
MVSPSHGNHLSRDSTPGRIFQVGRGFGMITSRKRLNKILNPIGKNMERKTWPWSFRIRREKERVPRVTVRGKPHS